MKKSIILAFGVGYLVVAGALGAKPRVAGEREIADPRQPSDFTYCSAMNSGGNSCYPSLGGCFAAGEKICLELPGYISQRRAGPAASAARPEVASTERELRRLGASPTIVVRPRGRSSNVDLTVWKHAPWTYFSSEAGCKAYFSDCVAVEV